jgi:cellobiose phosphorylase
MKSFKEYGSFDSQPREFVIANPRTPRPWINYFHTANTVR